MLSRSNSQEALISIMGSVSVRLLPVEINKYKLIHNTLYGWYIGDMCTDMSDSEDFRFPCFHPFPSFNDAKGTIGSVIMQ